MSYATPSRSAVPAAKERCIRAQLSSNVSSGSATRRRAASGRRAARALAELRRPQPVLDGLNLGGDGGGDEVLRGRQYPLVGADDRHRPARARVDPLEDAHLAAVEVGARLQPGDRRAHAGGERAALGVVVAARRAAEQRRLLLRRRRLRRRHRVAAAAARLVLAAVLAVLVVVLVARVGAEIVLLGLARLERRRPLAERLVGERRVERRFRDASASSWDRCSSM